MKLVITHHTQKNSLSTETNRQTRKLQLSGGSTFVVSLPKAWIKDLKINAGDDIVMTKNPNRSLTFMPDAETMQEKAHQAVAQIGPKDSDESVKRKVIAMYLAGYKSIRLTTKGVKMRPNQANMIRNLVRSTMIGTEIVDSDSESLMIQILTRLPEMSFDVALKRMHLMTVNIHKEAIESLADANIQYANDVIKLDDEVDRFSLYMLRNLTMAVQNADILQEMGLERPEDCLGYRTVISRIERIADHATLIAKRVKHLDGPVDAKTLKKITALSQDALAVFEKAIESLVSCNYKMAEETAAGISDTVSRQEEIMYTLKDGTKNLSVIKFILDDIRRTAEYSSDIAEVVMDKNIQSVITER